MVAWFKQGFFAVFKTIWRFMVVLMYMYDKFKWYQYHLRRTERGPVVWTPVRANPRLTFTLRFFFFLWKAFFRIVFSILFRVYKLSSNCRQREFFKLSYLCSNFPLTLGYFEQFPVWMTHKPRKGDFRELKSKKFQGEACPPHPPKSWSLLRGTQRQFSGKYLFGRRFEI